MRAVADRAVFQYRTAVYGDVVADADFADEPGADDAAAFADAPRLRGAGFGSLANGRLAPLAAPYVLGQSWAGAYIDSTGTEDGLLRATYRLGYDKQELVVDTWFTEELFTPQYAEISADGRMVLSIRISNFAMQ